eukprot:1138032-Pelagomonas_calceolata.AAC.2
MGLLSFCLFTLCQGSLVVLPLHTLPCMELRAHICVRMHARLPLAALQGSAIIPESKGQQGQKSKAVQRKQPQVRRMRRKEGSEWKRRYQKDEKSEQCSAEKAQSEVLKMKRG